MTSKDCDIVAESLRMWFQRVGFDFFFPYYIQVIILLLYEQVRARHAFFFSFFFGFVRQDTSIWYHMIPNVLFVVFGGHSTQTDCGSCRADPKMRHAAKRSLAMCEHTEGFLRDFVVLFLRDTCREHSLFGRRNCFMTTATAANSPSAAAGPEISINRNPIANLSSD